MVAEAPAFRLQLPPVFDYQTRALFDPIRYAVVEGSTKVGKTYPAMVWLLEMVGRLPGPDHNFWWVAPTVGQALIAYTRMKRMLLLADPSKTIWSSHDTERKITIHNCGHLWFKTGEVPDNLYGEDVYAAVMDEYTRQREEAWFALRSTLTATQGQCRFVGNVKGRKNWGWVWARKAESGEPGMRYTKLTCWDAVEAGIMSREEVEQAQRDLPEAVFRELYLAEPSDDGNNPFGLRNIASCVHPMHDTCTPVAWGWDLARATDYTVGIGLCEHGCCCRYERWNQNTLPASGPRLVKPGDSHKAYWAVTLKRIQDLTGYTPALVDSTGPGGPIDQALMADGHINFEGYVFSSRSKQLLMEGLALAIQRGEVQFPEGPIKSELEMFEYEYTRTGVIYTAPEGYHDDCVCALALAVQAWRNVQTGQARLPVFTSEAIAELLERAGKHEPPRVGNLTHAQTTPSDMDLSIAGGAVDDIGFKDDAEGVMKLWCRIYRNRPDSKAQHVVYCAAGDGKAAPGCIVVAETTRRSIVAQYVRKVPPERLARVAAMLSLWFGRPDEPAQLGYIATSTGRVLGQHLGRLGFDAVAWDPDPEEFSEAVNLMRAAWEAGQLVEPDPDVFKVARDYIWANNAIMHAALLGQTERRGSHADAVMARAGLWRLLGGLEQPEPDEVEPPFGSSEYWIRQNRRKLARGNDQDAPFG